MLIKGGISMIEICGVSKSFKDHEVLRDLNLSIPDKKILGLIGINGAGKSTLLRVISGIYSADDGIVLVDGENAYDNEEVKRKMFFLSDDPFYTARTTPASLLTLMNTFYPVNEVTYFETLDKFKIPIHKRMDKFSKGMKRQVFVSLAFAIRPKYMLLDEAFDGLDPLARVEFKNQIKDMVEKMGSTVIISSHSLKELEDLCDAFAILNNTTIAASGSIEEAIGVLHKYQIAFKEDPDIHFFPRIYKHIEKDGRVIRLVSELNLKDIEEKLKDMNPVFIDELPIEFEEVFTAIVENGGKMK